MRENSTVCPLCGITGGEFYPRQSHCVECEKLRMIGRRGVKGPRLVMYRGGKFEGWKSLGPTIRRRVREIVGVGRSVYVSDGERVWKLKGGEWKEWRGGWGRFVGRFKSWEDIC